MPTEYTLSDLVKLTGVSPRTVRYYIAQGLLPSPIQQGPNTRYTEVHLDRLRLIRKLQAAHLPLAEIRRQIGTLPDDQLASLAESTPDYAAPADSALAYIQSLLRPRQTMVDRSIPAQAAPATTTIFRAEPPAAAPSRAMAEPPAPAPTPESAPVSAPAPATASASAAAPAPTSESEPASVSASAPESKSAPAAASASAEPVPPTQPSRSSDPDRAQWERITLDPDVELHIRRPLTRQQNRRVERLISIARQLLEED